jgi:hypothetical protein
MIFESKTQEMIQLHNYTWQWHHKKHVTVTHTHTHMCQQTQHTACAHAKHRDKVPESPTWIGLGLFGHQWAHTYVISCFVILMYEI